MDLHGLICFVSRPASSEHCFSMVRGFRSYMSRVQTGVYLCDLVFVVFDLSSNPLIPSGQCVLVEPAWIARSLSHSFNFNNTTVLNYEWGIPGHRHLRRKYLVDVKTLIATTRLDPSRLPVACLVRVHGSGHCQQWRTISHFHDPRFRSMLYLSKLSMAVSKELLWLSWTLL